MKCWARTEKKAEKKEEFASKPCHAAKLNGYKRYSKV